MGMLEDRFRRRFERCQNGLLFRQYDRAVIFSREEVEAFVERWRLCATPELWLLWAVLGLGPALLLWLGIGPMLAWVGLCLLANGLMIVWLYHSYRLPDEAAVARESVGSGHGWAPGIGFDLTMIAIALNLLWITPGEQGLDIWMTLGWGMILMLYAWRIVSRIVRWRRRPAA